MGREQSKELEGDIGGTGFCGFVFSVLTWGECKVFYLLENEVKRKKFKNLGEDKKIYELVMIHSTLNTKGYTQPRRLGPE